MVKLGALDLNDTQLAGAIPAEISALVKLEELFLSSTTIEPIACRADADSAAAVQKLIKTCTSPTPPAPPTPPTPPRGQ